MRRLVLLFLLLSTTRLFAATPVVIQYFGTPNSSNTGVSLSSSFTIHVPLARAAITGDSIEFCFNNAGGTVWTVQLGSETMTQGVHSAVVAGSYHNCYYLVNITGGETGITVTHTTGSATYWGGVGWEANNISSYDVASTCTSASGVGQAAGATATSGSITPTVSGDWLSVYTWQYQTPQVATNYAPVTHANITWQLIDSQLEIAQAMMVGQYNSTTAFTPSMTQTNNQTWSMCTDAFKTGTSGASGFPTGEVVAGEQSETILAGGSNPSNMQITPIGNTVVVVNATAYNAYFTSVTSSPSVTWTIASRCFDSGTATEVDAFYATGLTPGTTYNIAMTLSNGSAGDSALTEFDIADGTTPNIGSAGTCNSGIFSAVSGNLNTSLTTGGGAATNTSFVPTAANGIVISADSVDYDTNTGTTTTGAFINMGWFSGATQTGNTAYYENDGALTYPHSSTSGVAFIYTIASSPPNTSTDVNYWSNRNLDIPQGSSSSITPPQIFAIQP